MSARDDPDSRLRRILLNIDIRVRMILTPDYDWEQLDSPPAAGVELAGAVKTTLSDTLAATGPEIGVGGSTIGIVLAACSGGASD